MAQSRALVVVDVQQEYFTGLLPIQYPPREESVLKVANAIDAAAGAGIPVVVVQHSAGDRSPVFNPTLPTYELHPAVEERRSDAWKPLVKQHGSVFAGTDLEDWLRDRGIDTVTLVGYMTNNCILASSVEAEARGIRAEVLSDATGAVDIANAAGSVRAKTVHETLMAMLNSNFAAVATTDEWVRAVASGAGLPKSNLVESAAAGRDR
ncbi:cysteine hydrolase family protein [Nocardiopsis tropica]|uniref:isochorismatase family protein n=1 Tax=Nocardiopsis tropica TaxID=109330 RepID=UPI0031D44BA2